MTSKSKMNKMDVNTIIFCTSKTLNERFTPKRPRCVFIINNGYTRPFKSNKLNARVIFENDMDTKIHKRFAAYAESNLEETKEIGGNEMNKLEQESSPTINRRRVVLMPTKISDNRTPVARSKIWKNVRRTSRRRKPKFGRSRNSLHYHFVRNKCLKAYKRTEPISRPSMNRFYNRGLYTWKRPPPTKEELDNELDSYMANLNSETSTDEDVEPFVQEYMTEVEKYLNDKDDAQLGLFE